jgi:hypothetical protein
LDWDEHTTKERKEEKKKKEKKKKETTREDLRRLEVVYLWRQALVCLLGQLLPKRSELTVTL